VTSKPRDGLLATGVVYEVYGHLDTGGGVDTDVFQLLA